MTLAWKKYFPFSDQNAFICLVDLMGDDSSIVQAARVSYGKDERESLGDKLSSVLTQQHSHLANSRIDSLQTALKEISAKDRQLIRYLMNHQHSSPFEMVEFKFMVQVPMDCWRQWVRHRTASINEYSTRYMEALDFFQVTDPTEWRLQSTDNKQGSSGYLREWPEGTQHNEYITLLPGGYECDAGFENPQDLLTSGEQSLHYFARKIYEERLALGIAKEQARKDLPLSTYTRAYWKCDLHNIFNFLRLRMDSHAQLEIRSFANCMFEIIKQVCPTACEAFEDYVLHAKRFSRMEMEYLRDTIDALGYSLSTQKKPSSMTDREWKEFLEKLE